MTASVQSFRTSFKVSREMINWFPGHMNSSFKHMQAKMRMVDCIVEVHDSRIPFSGRNPQFLKNLLGEKPHILVLNKKDLIDKSKHQQIQSKYQEESENEVIFTNCLDQRCQGLKQIVPLALDLIGRSPRQNISDEVRYKMMVVGIPNVGKSSLINALRNKILHRGKATAVGGVAGITRKVQNEIKVSSDPPMYLIDTPGILLPNILDSECGMKLALCACLKDDLVGMILIADFLLYWMNKTNNFSYVELFELQAPTDSILPLLIKIALSQNKMKKMKNIAKNRVETVPDVHYAASQMVGLFRKGKMGDLNLDKEFF